MAVLWISPQVNYLDNDFLSFMIVLNFKAIIYKLLYSKNDSERRKYNLFQSINTINIVYLLYTSNLVLKFELSKIYKNCLCTKRICRQFYQGFFFVAIFGWFFLTLRETTG